MKTQNSISENTQFETLVDVISEWNKLLSSSSAKLIYDSFIDDSNNKLITLIHLSLNELNKLYYDEYRGVIIKCLFYNICERIQVPVFMEKSGCIRVEFDNDLI